MYFQKELKFDNAKNLNYKIKQDESQLQTQVQTSNIIYKHLLFFCLTVNSMSLNSMSIGWDLGTDNMTALHCRPSSTAIELPVSPPFNFWLTFLRMSKVLCILASWGCCTFDNLKRNLQLLLQVMRSSSFWYLITILFFKRLWLYTYSSNIEYVV